VTLTCTEEKQDKHDYRRLLILN